MFGFLIRHFYPRSPLKASLTNPVCTYDQVAWLETLSWRLLNACDSAIDPDFWLQEQPTSNFSGAIVPSQIALRARWCSWRLWSSLLPVPLWCKCHPASRLHIERRGFLILSNKKASAWMMSSMETKRCLAWEHGAASFRSWGPTSTSTQRLCRTCCNLLAKILKELTWTLVWSKTWRTRRFRSRFRTSPQTRRSWPRLCKRMPWCSRWWQWIQSLQSWWKAQKLCNGFWAQRFSRKCSMVVLMKTPSRASWKRPLPQNRLVQGRRRRRATWGTRQICFPRCCHQMSLLCFLKVA